MKLIKKLLFPKQEGVKHTRNYLIGQLFVGKGINVLLSPLTTSELATIGYGINKAYYSAEGFMEIFVALALYRGVTRFFYDSKYDRKQMLSTQFQLLMVVMSLMAAILMLAMPAWRNIANLTVHMAVLVIIHSYLQSIIAFYLAYLQAHKKSEWYASYSSALAFLSTVIGVALMYVIKDAPHLGLLYGAVGVRACFAAYAIFAMRHDIRKPSSKTMRKEVWRFCIPLIPQLFASRILVSSDVMMIDRMVGKSETGIYGFADTFGSLITIVTYALNQAWAPEFYDLMDQKQYTVINRRLRYYFNTLLTVATGIILFSKEAVYVLAGDPDFYPAYSIIPILVYGYLMFYVYTNLSNYAVYAKKTEFLAITTAISGLTNISLNFLLIPIYGYQIAAVTTLAAYVVQYVVYYVFDRFWFHSVVAYQSYPFWKLCIYMLGTYGFFLLFEQWSLPFLVGIAVKGMAGLAMVALIWLDVCQVSWKKQP